MGHSRVKVKQVISETSCKEEVLKQLMKVCYHAMTYQSQFNHKGNLHRVLQSKLTKELSSNPTLNDEQLKQYVRDLFRISFCYRPTSPEFFQANYADSQTARKVIKMMKEEAVYKKLPLAAVLLGDASIDLSTMSDIELINAAIRLRESEDWEFASSEIPEHALSRIESSGPN